MSIFDSLLNNVKGEGGSLMGVAQELLDKVGGVQGLANVLKEHGLEDKISSWIGHGDNQPVSGQDLGDALQKAGHGTLLNEAADKLGINSQDLLDKLSNLLPHAVDHLTPDGQAPSGSKVDLAGLKQLAEKLFSKN